MNTNHDALHEALEVLESATSFATKKARDGHTTAVKALREALAASKPEAFPHVATLIEAANSAARAGFISGTTNWAAHVQHFLAVKASKPELCNYPDCRCPIENPCLQGKPEPHPPSRLCMCDDCKPSFEDEPQAQAGEPEVFVFDNGCEFVTLQAYREAMTAVLRHKEDWKSSCVSLQKQRNALQEDLAKKDAALKALAEQGATAEKQALEVINRLHCEAAEMRAALKACVEALRVSHEQMKLYMLNYKPGWNTYDANEAAITQAQEVQR